MIRTPLALAVAALATIALAGCAQDLPAAGSTASDPPALSGTITVDAAASLNEVFPALAKEFEAAHPGTTVDFSFGGSSTLAAQIVAGAPVDVFAAASTTTMQTVQDADLAGRATVVARNKLEIAVPKGNPGSITGLADFADPAKTIVVCAEEVPCGAAAQQVFQLKGIHAQPDSYEPDVTSVLTKVRTGNADAGLVYVTDVRAAGDQVEGIPFATADKAITDYPIATVKGTRDPALAEAWVAYVAAHERDLQAAGFLPPQ